MDYTQEQMRGILDELHIQPYRGGMVDSNQAARILTWRSEHEMQTSHVYSPTSVRRHVTNGHLTPEPIHTRMNLYPVDGLFALTLMPRRAAGGRQRKARQNVGS